MKRILLVIFTACLLTACSSKSTASNDSKYPGFTKVATEGPGSKFYVDTSSLKRKDGLISFKLLQLLSDGYAIQPAAIGTNGQFTSESGVKYNEDGTAAGELSGIPLSADLESQPGLSAVVNFVRNEYNRKNAIVGKFEESKALELLYGAYRADLNGVQRESLPIPNGQEDTGLPNEGIARVFLSKEFSIAGKQKHVVLVATNSEDNECHACRPFTSAAIFEQLDGKWQLWSEYPYIDVPGAYGKPANCSWRQIGTDKYGLVMDFTGGGQGYLCTVFNIVLLNKSGTEEVLTHTIDYSMDDPFDCDLKLEPSKKEFWDVTITATNVQKRSRVSQSNYRFSSDKYILFSGKPSSDIEQVNSPDNANDYSSIVTSQNLSPFSKVVLNHFIKRAKNTDESWLLAYQDCSTQWKQRNSFTRFSSYAGKWFVKDDANKAFLGDKLIDDSNAEVYVDMSYFTDLEQVFTIYLVKENGSWLIDKLSPRDPTSSSDNGTDSFGSANLGFSFNLPHGTFFQESYSSEKQWLKLKSKDAEAEITAWTTHESEPLDASTLLEHIVKNNPSWQFTYKKEGNNWVAVSGYDGDKIFYQKVLLGNGGSSIFLIKYKRTDKQKFVPSTEMLAASFKKLAPTE